MGTPNWCRRQKEWMWKVKWVRNKEVHIGLATNGISQTGWNPRCINAANEILALAEWMAQCVTRKPTKS